MTDHTSPDNLAKIPMKDYSNQPVIDLSKTDSFKDFSVQIAETEGRRNGQEDAFFTNSPNPRPSHEMGDFLLEAFKQTQAKTLGLNDGATGTVAAVSTDNTLTLAHLGDSPAMLMVRDGETGKVQVHNLLKEHKPTDPEERARIEREGGHVLGMRVVSNHGHALAVARAFGDNDFPGVGHVPDITSLKIDDYAKPGDQVFLCVSCDGLLEANEPEDFAQILEQQMNQGNSQNLADHFVNKAYQSGSRDNITAMVVEIPPTRDRDLVIGIADGHGGRATADLVVDNLKKMTLKTTADLKADGVEANSGPPTAPPPELETAPLGQQAAPSQPVPPVPNDIDLGGGFGLGKKTYPNGETFYRISGLNGTNTDQAIEQAKQQGYDVKERKFDDGVRLVAEPAEVEAAWQRHNAPPPIVQPVSADVPLTIDLGGGFGLGKKTYPNGETFYRISGLDGTNTAQAIGQAKQQGYEVKERTFDDGVRLVAEPAQVEANWQKQQIAPANAQAPSLPALNMQFLQHKRENAARDPMQERQTFLNEATSGQLGGATWQINEGKGNVKEPHLRLSVDNPDDAIRMCSALKTAGIPCVYATKADKALVIIAANDIDQITPDRAKASGQIYQS